MDVATGIPGDTKGEGWSSDQDSFDDTIWIRAAYGIIASLGICGNSLVIFTIIRVKSLQNLMNFFIASLAATDFITSVFLIPLNMDCRGSNQKLGVSEQTTDILLAACGTSTRISTKAASVSKVVKEADYPVTQILSQAGWQLEQTFQRFYNKPVPQLQRGFVEALLED